MAMWSSGQALKLLWDVGYIFWSLASDQFKADMVTANYTMVTSQGLLLWLWSQGTSASISWQTEKCTVEISFPARYSFLSLHCFYCYSEIFKDWGYFLPDYSQPYKTILPLCREEGLDVHQVQRAIENTLFSPEKMENWDYPLLWRTIQDDFWRNFYLEVTQILSGMRVEYRSSKQQFQWCLISIHIKEEWPVIREDYFFK